MSTTQQPDVLNILGAPLAVKATFARAGQFILDHVVPPGYAVPPHFHADEDEAYLVLEGAVTFSVDGKEQVAGPGDFLFAPRQRPHSFRNVSGAPARMIVLCTPGAKLEAFFRKLDAEAKAGAPDVATVTRLAAAQDITIA